MTSPTTVRSHLDARWRTFAEHTTLHGFREILRSDAIVIKLVWSLIIVTSTGALIYQSRGIVEPYLAESTVTQIVALNRTYPPPRVMIGIPTHLLIRSERQNTSQQPPEMDPEAFVYARSIVEAETVIPNEIAGDFDPDRAKRKFEEYLLVNNLSWAQAIEPHMFDLTPWISSVRFDPDIVIPRRLIWYPFTYYIVEPKVEIHTRPTSYLPITWDGRRSQQSLALRWSTNPIDRLTHVIVSSYSILDDIFPLRRGDKYKLQFDISAHVRLNLDRRPCKQYDDDRLRYKKYDYFACREVCSLKAIHRRFPNACLRPPHTSYSLLDFHPRGIPCSDGIYVLMGKNGSRERIQRKRGEQLPVSQALINDTSITNAIIEDSKSCESSQCNPPPCNELTISYQLNQAKLADDEPNDASMLILNFPPPEDIIVFEEKHMYTSESLIGQWGGLAGLYLGASLMSFLEVICVWCSCCCGGCVRRKED